MRKNDIEVQTEKYPIAILGGGPAGYVAAIRAAQLGARVALIEKDQLGGVCLNAGCIPTKALLRTAELLASGKMQREFGVASSGMTVDWASAGLRKDRVVKNLRLGVQHLMDANRIEVFRGTGTVIDPHRLSVETADGTIEITCNKMILTTGAEPLIPDSIRGTDLAGVLTSTDVLTLWDLPASIVIIGAGVIGLEFAGMFAAAGVKVTILEFAGQLLPSEDREIAEEFVKLLKRQRIKVVFNAQVTEICQDGGTLIVRYQLDGQEQTAEGERVLLAAGRKQNLSAVDALSLETEHGHIVVDEHMQTSISDVYAAGDVIGGRLLAHLAFMEGRVAAENAMGIASTVNYNAVPACIYSSPEIASVGLTEEAARVRGITPRVGRFQMRSNGRALTLGEREGFVKVVADENGMIIGGQILGANASELISELTLAITLHATAEQLADMIHPHPSLSEAVWEACGEIAQKAIHKA